MMKKIAFFLVATSFMLGFIAPVQAISQASGTVQTQELIGGF
ncbi:hypothetical protein [Paenibacillus sp. 8b26]